MTLQVVAIVGATLGVASHLGYFIHGEHHMQSTRILAFFIIVPLVLFVIASRYTDGDPYLEAGKVTAFATGSYFTALSISIVIYRVFFHPLRNFPGPFSARLSKVTHMLQIAKNSRNFSLAEQMFERYGEFVRLAHAFVNGFRFILIFGDGQNRPQRGDNELSRGGFSSSRDFL
jgi:hypothetical protein